MDEAYWKRFEKRNDKASDGIVRDGRLFEDLVEHLMASMYGDGCKRTKTTHDFNRDFHIFIDGEEVWAECKNYKGSITMSVLAPTLVMAQVFDASTLLFFSVSRINDSAKRKILLFGEKCNKRVFFYDGEDLETLVKARNDDLPSNFKIGASNDVGSNCNIRFDEILLDHATAGDLADESELESQRETNKAVLETSTESIFSYTVFANNPLLGEKVRIELLFETPDIEFCRPLIDYDLLCGRPFRTADLEPGQSIALTTNFVPTAKSGKFETPAIRVKLESRGKAKDAHLGRKVIEFKLSEKVELIGEWYFKCKRSMADRIKNHERFLYLEVIGGSGVGKTRLLSEAKRACISSGYQVIDYTACRDFASHFLIRSIVAFLFEIPDEEISALLKQRIKHEEGRIPPKSEAIRIYDELCAGRSENALTRWLKSDACELLFETISSRRIALLVDNVQYCGDAFLVFLRTLAAIASNRQGGCETVLICAVNTDFSTDSSDDFCRKMHELPSESLLSCSPRGFSSTNQARMFLRELVRSSNSSSDNVFERIIDKVGLNPYRLRQAIYLLEDRGAIRGRRDQSALVVENAIALDVIGSLGGPDDEVLGKRFEVLLSVHPKTRAEYLRALSALYLFDHVDQAIMDSLRIERKTFADLAKRHFAQERHGIFAFEHDIIRTHFFASYESNSLDCLRTLTTMGNLSCYDEVATIYQIAIKGDHAIACQKLSSITRYDADNRLALLYFKTLLEFAINSFPFTSDEESDINSLSKVCAEIKRFGSYDQISNSLEKATKAVEHGVSKVFNLYPGAYGSLLSMQFEHLLMAHDKSSSEILFNKVLNRVRDAAPANQKAQEDLTMLEASALNRLYVAYNADKSKSAEAKRRRWMAESRKVGKRLKLPENRRVVEYLNDSDEGYGYYGLEKDREKLLGIWNRCLVDMPEAAPQKTMNYYRKKAQINLLNNDIEGCFESISEGELYLETGEFAHEPIVFGCFFSLSKATALLMENDPLKHTCEISQYLDDAFGMQPILKNRKLTEILWARGVLAAFQQDAEAVYQYFKEALLELDENKSSRYWIKTELLRENVKYTFSKMSIFDSGRDLNFLKGDTFTPLSDIELSMHCGTGVLRTHDDRLNLPLV